MSTLQLIVCSHILSFTDCKLTGITQNYKNISSKLYRLVFVSVHFTLAKCYIEFWHWKPYPKPLDTFKMYLGRCIYYNKLMLSTKINCYLQLCDICMYCQLLLKTKYVCTLCSWVNKRNSWKLLRLACFWGLSNIHECLNCI